MSVDVVIPAYKPDEKFIKLLTMLSSQTVMPGKIIVMNTLEEYWPKKDIDLLPDPAKSLLEVHHITKEEFDHGQTRNEGVSHSDADFVILMTDDAVPDDEYLIEELIKPFEDEKVGAVYARQLPGDKASPSERFSRAFNYPAESLDKSLDDIKSLGIKTFFCSNVCAAYRRDEMKKNGGFVKEAIFNEDMVYAGLLIDAGWHIYYAADARVIHSHSYNNMEQFHRNFDIAVSQAMHPEVFERVSSESEGVKFMMKAFGYFVSIKRPFAIFPFVITSVYKLIGFKLGKKYESLSHEKILKYTMNPAFFIKLWKKGEVNV